MCGTSMKQINESKVQNQPLKKKGLLFNLILSQEVQGKNKRIKIKQANKTKSLLKDPTASESDADITPNQWTEAGNPCG